MNLLSGNFIMQLDLTLEALRSQFVGESESDVHDQSPLSPNNTAEVDGLPLKKISTKLALNGQMIQVLETQICCTQGDVPLNATVIEMETL